MRTAQFINIGIGIATETIALNSRVLQVCPIEQFSFIDGEITEDAKEYIFSGTNIDGSVYQEKLITDNTFPATWLPNSSNRVFPPNVERGERVELYRYGASSKYYWRPMGLDDKLRRQETIIIAIAASPDGAIRTNEDGSEDLDPSKCYFIEFSSHTKAISLHTSKAQGEPFAYEFSFNLANGEVVLGDDKDTKIYMNSGDGEIGFQNSYGSVVRAVKDSLEFKATKATTASCPLITINSDNCNVVSKNVTVTSEAATVTAAGLLRLVGGSIRLVSGDIKSSTPIELG